MVKKSNRKMLWAPSADTIEFDYKFQTSKYHARIKILFNTDDKVRFYTCLPSMEVLMVVFGHVSLHVTRQTQSLNWFHEFIIVPMKLRLNAPLQDIVYRFVVLLSNVSTIFSHNLHKVVTSRKTRIRFYTSAILLDSTKTKKTLRKIIIPS